MLSRQFSEYEAFAEQIQNVSVTLRISSLEHSLWSLQRIMAGALSVQRGCEGGGTIAEGATVGSGWTFFHQRNPVRINGKVVTEQDIYVIPPGGEFCLASHHAHEWFAVYVPTELLHQVPNDLEFAARAKPHMLKSPPGVARQFTTLVHRFLTAAESRPQLLDSPNAIASVQNELLASVKQLFMTSQHSASRHYERWREQTMSATEVALKEPELGMVVSEASTHLGVPERTLRAAFQSCYGLSPVKYLRILRLHQARHLLLTHCPDQTSVTQIASEVGFWELGRFSRDYRKLFGELPSETLRKPIRKGHP